jgi:hypothetical protein
MIRTKTRRLSPLVGVIEQRNSREGKTTEFGRKK